MVSRPRADVLLVTVTKVESKAVLEAFCAAGQKERPEQIDDRTYFDLGTVNGARVWMTQTQMGSSGLGASQQAIEKGIAALSPAAVIMVGIAFGVNEAKQKIGDVLVTKQLRPYDLQRVGTHEGQPRIVLRGDKPPASPWLVNQLETAELSWEGATVRFGVVLTGEKLVDNLDYRDQLHSFETEAIGGEMEGTGLYVACHDKKVDWILVKAICDWADGNKAQDKEGRQALAAKNATSFVLYALHFVKVDWAQRRITRGGGAMPMARTPADDLAGLHEGQPASPAPGRSSLPRQPLFFGREEELKSIAEALAPESRTWGVLIDGPGGIGKTALAVRAGHLAPAEHFDRKIFVSAKIREMTLAGEQRLEDFMLPNFVALLTELAHELGDKDIARLPENERANTVRRSLADQRALIIIDNVETFQEPEQTRLGQFLERLPTGCKAIVTSRRRRDVAARILRLDRLAQKDAMDLLDALSETNARLKAASSADRQRLYEVTGGNPLILRWTVGQLGRKGSHCRTVDEACEFLAKAPPGNDPLEYVFGDLLDTFTESETAVLAALVHFSLPAQVSWIATVAGLAERQAQTALDDLDDRALLVSDPGGTEFLLPPLAATYLRRKRPEAVTQAGNRLVERAVALIFENGFEKYERFPNLEAAWPAVNAALPLILRGENSTLQLICSSLNTFMDFCGRWDEHFWLHEQAEARAIASGDLDSAGQRAYATGYTRILRRQAAEVFACADRAAKHWLNIEMGSQRSSAVLTLRGHGYHLNGDYHKSIKSFSQALALLRALNPTSSNVASCLNNLSATERAMGNFAESERHQTEALQISRQINHQDGIATCTGNLAEIALDREDWSQAEGLAREALTLAEVIGRQDLIGSNCHRLAKALVSQGELADSLPYAQRAVDIFSRLKSADLADAQATLHECTAEGSPPPGAT